MENEDDMSKLVSNYAIENFKNGLNCSESVYNALIRAGALDAPPETVAMCVGFGGGVGLSGCMCGALAASILANGAKYGRKDPYSVDAEVRGSEIADKYYSRYNNLIHDFTEKYGSPLCNDICSKFGVFHSHERKVGCLKMIGGTAALAYQYLQIAQEEAEKMPYKENLGGRV
jgi:C_GCAxxG_C_C family probable redox protein